ncbi:hypothetical protein WDW89_02965 [Deltaproteobacteria bacterium TL4]
MDVTEGIKILGLMASVVLPFFNLPLIIKIKKRGSSKDLSLTWAVGVWSCILLMMPSVVLSSDIVFKVFGVLNFILFTGVAFYVLKYR